jgi:hypothetical protein
MTATMSRLKTSSARHAIDSTRRLNADVRRRPVDGRLRGAGADSAKPHFQKGLIERQRALLGLPAILLTRIMLRTDSAH